MKKHRRVRGKLKTPTVPKKLHFRSIFFFSLIILITAVLTVLGKYEQDIRIRAQTVGSCNCPAGICYSDCSRSTQLGYQCGDVSGEGPDPTYLGNYCVKEPECCSHGAGDCCWAERKYCSPSSCAGVGNRCGAAWVEDWPFGCVNDPTLAPAQPPPPTAVPPTQIPPTGIPATVVPTTVPTQKVFISPLPTPTQYYLPTPTFFIFPTSARTYPTQIPQPTNNPVFYPSPTQYLPGSSQPYQTVIPGQTIVPVQTAAPGQPVFVNPTSVQTANQNPGQTANPLPTSSTSVSNNNGGSQNGNTGNPTGSDSSGGGNQARTGEVQTQPNTTFQRSNFSVGDIGFKVNDFLDKSKKFLLFLFNSILP